MFVARYSNHIQEDIQRGWSSWNFGTEGIEATADQIEAWKAEAIENDSPFYISGFEFWGDDIKTADIRELYSGYWVLVDNVNACGQLSCVELNAITIEEAVAEYGTKDYSGDGDSFDPSDASLVFTSACGEFHIFEIED